MNDTNNAKDYKKRAILVSTMLHFLDPEFEYQCQLNVLENIACLVILVQNEAFRQASQSLLSLWDGFTGNLASKGIQRWYYYYFVFYKLYQNKATLHCCEPTCQLV